MLETTTNLERNWLRRQWSHRDKIQVNLTSDFLTCSANWNFSVGVGTSVGWGGGNSVSGMLECGKTWKKHIKYIITDFLSGLSTFTSEKKSQITNTISKIHKFINLVEKYNTFKIANLQGQEMVWIGLIRAGDGLVNPVL